jgi:signal transduction histidine kinase
MSRGARLRLDERWPQGWRSLAFDVALAMCGIAGGVIQAARSDSSQPALAIALAVGGGAVLVARRARPLAVLAVVLAVTTALAPLGVGDGEPIEGNTVRLVIALYTTAALCERRTSLAALGATAALAGLLSGLTAHARDLHDPPPLGSAAATMTICAGIWGLGAYAQTRHRYLRELEQRAVLAEREREQLARIAVHEERTSIARELHDIVAHSVTVMLIGVRGARDVLHTAPAVADDTLAHVETSGEQSLAELRRILALLREPTQRAESRPQPSLADLEPLIAGYRDAGLPVRLELAGEPRALPGGVELSAYRIVQEALTNVLKHARATHVTVALAFRTTRLEIEVTDDGATPTTQQVGAGHGLLGMRERVALLGGELEAGRRVDGGFRVAARLPVGST